MSMLEDVKQQLLAAIPYADIDEDTSERLQQPQRTIHCSVPVRMDDNRLVVYKSYISIFDDGQIGKGGLRIHPSVDGPMIRFLATEMHHKCNLIGLPFGGMKAGICADPKKLSHREMERLIKGFTAAVSNSIGPDRAVLACDLGTDSMAMGWIFSEYKKIAGGNPADVVTGKPVALGGLKSRETSTALGGKYVLDYMLHAHPNLQKNKYVTVAIQGCGQVGSHLANFLFNDLRFKVIALSNEYGGIVDANGLNVPMAIDAMRKSNGHNWGAGSKVSNEELLGLPVDILVPAAIENVINAKTVGDVKARIILEMANGPTTFEADKVLSERGKIAIPDILANAGGVTMSYYEWLMNRTGDIGMEDRAPLELRKMMEKATQRVIDISQEKGISLRRAAYVASLNRIASVQKALGTSSYFRT